MRIRMGLALLAALGIVSLAPATAPAAKAPTTVRLSSVVALMDGENADYSGRVGSPRKNCKANRRVRVIHDSDPPFEIGRTRTDEKGRWSLIGPLPPDGDRVIVKVTRTRSCKGAREMYQIDR